MNKDPIIKGSLTEEEFNILLDVTRDPFIFCKFVYVIHPTKGKVQFDLYPFQKTLLYYFLYERFNVIKKFRQGGITELICAFSLWLCAYHPNKMVMFISIKERVAKKILRKIKYMYRNLLPFLKTKIVNGRPGDIGTGSEIEFSNGSLLSSIPTTEEAGRSEALSLLVIDEAAIVRWADKIWAAAFPTLSTGGSAIINSTPYGVGNWFHKLYVDSCSGGNGFNAINLKWQMHPERDMEWYNLQRQILGPQRTAQEIDGDFLASGNSVFDLLDIRAIEEDLSEYTPIELRHNGNLRLYKHPQPNKKYFIGSDVSTGRAKDYSAFSIMDKDGEEMGCFKGKLAVDQLSDLLMEIGKKYNRALIAPESNDIGLAVASKMQESGYRNLYYSTKILKKKGEHKFDQEKIPGWYTTSKNRPVIIAELEEDIRHNNIIIKDPFFVKEAYTFIYDEGNRPVALGKGKRSSEDILEDEVYNDDSIMAKAITNRIRKGYSDSILILPR